MIINSTTDPLAARALYKELRAFGVRDPVIAELEFNTFRGALCLFGRVDGALVSVHSSYFGKRRKNLYEPYMNWYIAYTTEDARRRGFASALYREAEKEAEARGCRRVKSLAGSAAGAWLHYSLRHSIWGSAPNGELIVDAPLPASAHLYKKGTLAPEQSRGGRERPMTKLEIREATRLGLRYDRREA